jgi:formamidopyrimidine-DNA glycosylase
MPEIAEVARMVDCLNTEYGGHDLLDIEVVGGRFTKSNDDTEMQLAFMDFPLSNVMMASKGKFMYWSSRPKDEFVHLFFTMGMAGSFGKKQKHSALQFTFDNGEVFFNDPRHFGTFRIVEDERELTEKLDKLGWDPLQEPKVPEGIVSKFRKHNRKKIGEFLMEQGPLVAGIGNYLRCEICWAAKIDPLRLISSLDDWEIEAICQQAINIIAEAYKHGGATIKTYSDLYGNVGTFFDQFKVYGKKTDPDGHPVLRVKDKNGRTLHYVPEVQL